MTDTVDPGTSYPYQNDNPRRPYLSSSAFLIYAMGFPGLWLLVGP